MNIKRIESDRMGLLVRMEQELNEAMIAAKIEDTENETEQPILSVLFDEMGNGDGEVFGEFCFTPVVSEEDAVQFFLSVITLTEELQKEHLATLYEAMSYINFILPTGGFSVDAGHGYLVFRLGTPIPINIKGDKLYEQMQIASGNAVAMCDAYYELLLQVAAGEIGIDEVKEFLGM